MINLFCKVKLDNKFVKFNYIKLPLNTMQKTNNKLLFMIDDETQSKVIGLVVNKEKDNYNIKIISDVEKIHSDIWESISEQLPSLNEVKIIDTQGMMIHVEIWIESIAEYIAVCQDLSSSNTLYRGQANKEWTLEPSIFRKDVNLEKEYHMYRDILQWNSDIFNTKDLIQDVCNMQHYGIPTRLMDWTSNPLHALYFATVNTGEKNSDGMVLNIRPESILEVDTEGYRDLNTFLAKRYRLDSKIDVEEATRVLEEISALNKGYLFFKARYSNDRIKVQQGYFSIYRDITIEEARMIRERKFSMIIEQIEKYLKETFEREPSTNLRKLIKKKITNDVFSIVNEIENIIKIQYNLEADILQKYKGYVDEIVEKSKISKIVDKRHCMSELLKNESYVKIVIQRDLKEQLIQELDVLGINSRIVYPDIQGLAQYMKEKYQ